MAKDPLPYLKAQKWVLEETFIRQLCLIIKEHILMKYKNQKIAIFTLAHDGIPPSHMIAREIGAPIYVINTATDIEFIVKSLPKDVSIIVLDDIYDTGKTYEKYAPLIQANEWIFLTAKQNVPEGTFCPCVLQTQAYIVYPWEKYDFEEDSGKTSIT